MLTLAHRGLVAAARPENTTAAVAAALSAGADGVEVDVRLTADGVLVASHDADLRRLTGAAATVADSTWQVLAEVASGAGVRLARVDQILAVAAGHRVVLELKPPPVAPDAHRRTASALVDELCRVSRPGVPLEVTVSSFSASLVGAVRARLPAGLGVRTALLGRPLDAPAGLVRRALDEGHDEVHPHVAQLLRDPRLVRAARSCGVLVVGWTVNRRADVLLCHRLRVDAVITDVPVLVGSLTNRYARPVVAR